MAKLKPENLAPLAEHINTCYDGHLLPLQNHLNQTIYMLHYLEPETFSLVEVQRVAYALQSLLEGLNASQQSL